MLSSITDLHVIPNSYMQFFLGNTKGVKESFAALAISGQFIMPSAVIKHQKREDYTLNKGLISVYSSLKPPNVKLIVLY